VATFGLLSVIWGSSRLRSASAVPFAVGAYITAAYWFTASTSFGEPSSDGRPDVVGHIRRYPAAGCAGVCHCGSLRVQRPQPCSSAGLCRASRCRAACGLLASSNRHENVEAAHEHCRLRLYPKCWALADGRGLFPTRLRTLLRRVQFPPQDKARRTCPSRGGHCDGGGRPRPDGRKATALHGRARARGESSRHVWAAGIMSVRAAARARQLGAGRPEEIGRSTKCAPFATRFDIAFGELVRSRGWERGAR
jgi:hypothetical protein